MAKIKISVTDTEFDGKELSKAFDFGILTLADVVEAYRPVYSKIQHVDPKTGLPEVDENGNPILSECTDTEVLALAAWGIAKGIRANIESYRREKAASEAKAAVASLSVASITGV